MRLYEIVLKQGPEHCISMRWCNGRYSRETDYEASTSGKGKKEVRRHQQEEGGLQRGDQAEQLTDKLRIEIRSQGAPGGVKGKWVVSGPVQSPENASQLSESHKPNHNDQLGWGHVGPRKRWQDCPGNNHERPANGAGWLWDLRCQGSWKVYIDGSGRISNRQETGKLLYVQLKNQHQFGSPRVSSKAGTSLIQKLGWTTVAGRAFAMQAEDPGSIPLQHLIRSPRNCQV